jgi:hypothetical protein
MWLKSVLYEYLKLFLSHKVSYDLIVIFLLALSILRPVVEAPARQHVVQPILAFPAHLTVELYFLAEHALPMISTDLHACLRCLLDLPLECFHPVLQSLILYLKASHLEMPLLGRHEVCLFLLKQVGDLPLPVTLAVDVIHMAYGRDCVIWRIFALRGRT